MEELKGYFKDQDCPIKEDEKKYKIQARFLAYENMKVKIKIEKVDENIYCIKMEKSTGSKMDLLKVFEEIKKYLSDLDMIL